MNPIPLAAPDGQVYAYACSLCHHVAGGSSLLSPPETNGPHAVLVESSLLRAQSCCTCMDCGAVIGSVWRVECAPCAWWRSWLSTWRQLAELPQLGPCTICGARVIGAYCRETPACVDCGEDHGGSFGGRCRDCDLDHIARGA